MESVWILGLRVSQVREGRKDRVCPEQGGQKHPSCLKLRAGPWGNTLAHRKQHTGMQKGLGTYLCTHTLLGLMQPGWNYNYLSGGCCSMSAADPLGHLGYCQRPGKWVGRKAPDSRVAKFTWDRKVSQALARPERVPVKNMAFGDRSRDPSPCPICH